MNFITSFFMFLFMFLFNSIACGGEIKFYPQEKSEDIAQARAVFDIDMVPIGRAESNPPFKISCKQKGVGRWMGTKEWVYNFKKPLPPGSNCNFKLNLKLKSADGKKLKFKKKSFTVETFAARVVNTKPGNNYTIKENEAIVLILNGPIKEKLLLKNLFFKVPNLEERVPIVLIKGFEKNQILKSKYYY